jgi:hypothetical protein
MGASAAFLDARHTKKAGAANAGQALQEETFIRLVPFSIRMNREGVSILCLVALLIRKPRNTFREVL